MISLGLTITPNGSSVSTTAESLGFAVLSIFGGGTEIDTDVEWSGSMLAPIILDQKPTWTEYKIRFAYVGASHSACEKAVSDLSRRMKRSVLAPTGWDFTLNGHLDGGFEIEWHNNVSCEIEAKFLARKLCTSQTLSVSTTVSSKIINGNARVPMKITFSGVTKGSSGTCTLTLYTETGAWGISFPASTTLSLGDFVIDGSVGAIYNLRNTNKTNISDWYTSNDLPYTDGGVDDMRYEVTNCTVTSVTVEVTGRYE